MSDLPATDARGRKMTLVNAVLYANRVPFDDLIEGHLYLLKARNTCVGIWTLFPECIHEWGQTGYCYARDKMGLVFLDEEHDYDGEHYATAIPLKDLGPTPVFEDDAAKLAWLVAKKAEHHGELSEFLHAALNAYNEKNP